MLVKRPQHLADSGVPIQQPAELLLIEIPSSVSKMQQRSSLAVRPLGNSRELSEFLATFSLEAFGNIFND